MPSTSSAPASSLSANVGIEALVTRSPIDVDFEPRNEMAAGHITPEKAVILEGREQLDSEMARSFITGLPFQFVSNPFYRSSYFLAASG